MRKHHLRFLIPLIAAQLLSACGGGGSGGSLPQVSGQALLLHYVSTVDGSEQPYGLYLPPDLDPKVPHPVVLYGHGYNGHATSEFSQIERQFADAHGWILVNLQGWKILFYDGPAEKEIDEVLAHIEKSFAIDRSRIFFQGSSMGATGAFRLGARRPGFFGGVAGANGWTDFRLWHAHWNGPLEPDIWEVHPCRYHLLEAASPLFFAENLERTPCFIVVHTEDAVVWPENGQKLHRRLDELGLPHAFEEKPGGHGEGYDEEAFCAFLETLDPKAVDEVHVKTRRLSHARDTWLALRKFLRWGRWAEARGSLKTGSSSAAVEVDLEVDNVRRIALYLAAVGQPAGKRVHLTVNGFDAGEVGQVGVEPAAPDLVLDLRWSGGHVKGVEALDGLDPFPPDGPLGKRPELEGPVVQALLDHVIAVYGTVHPDPDVTLANLGEAEKFASVWAEELGGALQVAADVDLTPEEIASHNLICFGSAESHKIIHDFYHHPGRAFTPPIVVMEDMVQTGKDSFQGERYGTFFCYPNPLAPDRLMIISHRNIYGTYHGLDGIGWYYPDYVVFDTSLPLRLTTRGDVYAADAFVEAGYFDREWDFPSNYEVAASTDSPVYVKGIDLLAAVSVEVLKDGNPVAGLSAGAFVARIDGLKAKILNWIDQGGGVYTFDVAVEHLAIAGYYLSVEVVGPVRDGEGWVRFTIE